MAKLPADLLPFEPTARDPFDATKAAHLLSRAGFGPAPGEAEKLAALGPTRAVASVLDFPSARAEELSKTDVPNLAGIEGLPKTFEERRRLYEGLSPQERQDLNARMNAANREAIFATASWWITRMVSGPYPAHEKLTFFWHGHFTTSARDERSAWLMWNQNETLRQHAAGQFGDFVKAISRDPAMIDYLNNQQNRKGRPNENYARELMELFTLGIGNYTENDIKEAARAFTGWHHDGELFLFRRSLHDTEPKTVFGKRGTFGGDEVIDIILDHPACAPYIASRLWSHFVYDPPEPDIAQALGAVLRENNYHIRPLLRTIFSSKRFYSSQAIGTQIKSPVQLVTSTLRALDVPVPRRAQLSGAFDAMGQVPFYPPNVKGWPGGRSWINTSTLFVRVNTAVLLARQLKPNQLNPEGLREGRDIVDYWVARLIHRPIDEGRRQTLVEIAGKSPNRETIGKVIELIVSLPEFQLC